MKLTFLGTASCYPTAARGVSSLALQLESGQVWLFDCGEGTQVQLQRSQLRMGKINKIFITHLHGDHTFGLPGLLCTLGNNGGLQPAAPNEELEVEEASSDNCDNKKAPVATNKTVDLYGPLGIRKMVLTALELSSSPLSYTLNIHELFWDEDQFPENAQPPPDRARYQLAEGDLDDRQSQLLVGGGSHRIVHPCREPCRMWDLCDGHVRVIAGAIRHRIPSYGFVITEKDMPGSLDVDKLKVLGVRMPGFKCGALKKGNSVVSDEDPCVVVRPEDVLGPVKRGRKVVILGDTHCPDEMAPLCQGCDLLVHESTMEDSLRVKAVTVGHSTPAMAADFALKVGAANLCLNHFSPRYKPLSHSKACPEEESAEKLRLEAETHLAGRLSECRVVAAEDLMVLSVERGRRPVNLSLDSS